MYRIVSSTSHFAPPHHRVDLNRMIDRHSYIQVTTQHDTQECTVRRSRACVCSAMCLVRVGCARRVPSAPSECLDIATSPVDSSDPNAMEKATPHSYTPCRCRCVGSQQTSSSLLSLPSASCVDASSARLVSSSLYLSLSFYGLRQSTIWYHGTRSTNKGSTQKEYKDIEKTQVASHEMRRWRARRGDLCLTPPRAPSALLSSLLILLCPSCPPGSHSAHRHHDLHARSG